jgi:hypothetical protein
MKEDIVPESQRAKRAHRRALALVVAASVAIAMAAPASALEPTSTGPSTVTSPYVLPAADGVHIESLLTVGDGSASNGYKMVGIPDGLGVLRQGANLVLYMNHEIGDSGTPNFTPLGIPRRHGQAGAFVSRWVIDPTTLRVKEGSDWFNPGVRFWDYPTGTYVTTAARFADNAVQNDYFLRFCSGTLSDPGIFYNASTNAGYHGQVYFANEEAGDNGRAFGVTKEGDVTALPRLGLFSWENTKPAPNQTDTTLVIGDEDGPTTGSQLWVYVGTKQRSGEPLAKAGLTNGDDHVLAAVNSAVTTDAQWRTTYGKGVAAAVKLVDNDWNQTGAAQNSQALADGLNLNRIEDGHWDPEPSERRLILHHAGWRCVGLRGHRWRYRRAVEAALRGYREPGRRRDADPPARWQRDAIGRHEAQQAGQHDDRHPRQPPDPGGPGQRQPPRPDRRLPDR